MHTYEPLSTEWDFSELELARFRSATDAAAWGERLTTARKWPQVWHLDAEGAFRCSYSGSPDRSLARWSDDPWDLWRSWRDGQAAGGCFNRWLVVEPRPHSEVPVVTEADAAAFVWLREELTPTIELVDAVIFDDQRHWWSMHELTCGTTAWASHDE